MIWGARLAQRHQLLALVAFLVISSAAANADVVGTSTKNDDSEFDQAYWREFLSTPFDAAAANDLESSEHSDQRELAYGYSSLGDYCDHSGFMQVDRVGKEKCIRRGQGLCKDGWEFGIYRKGESYFVQLRKESDRADPVYVKYEGATELCIGERPGNVAYMSIKFDHGTHYLLGRDVGSRNQLPRLKIRPQEGKCRGDNKSDRRMLGKCDKEVIVKYRDGAGDDDCLWEVFFDGKTNTCKGSGWVFIPSPTHDCQANVKMACVAERTCGAVSVTRDCDKIPQCSVADPCCDWTLSWNYKIVNDCAVPAEVTSFETTLCHGHCHGGMAPFGGCLEESDPDCNTLDLTNSLMPSGQMIGAGEIKVARMESWTTINLHGMEGAKIFGNSTAILKTSEGDNHTGEASKCINLCGEALMSRADADGGAEGHDAVIVDSIIVDEKSLEEERGSETTDSLASTAATTTDTTVNPGPITDAPASAAPVTPGPTSSPSALPVSATPTPAPVTPDPTSSPSMLPVSATPTPAPVTPDPTSSPSALPVSVIPTSTPTIKLESSTLPTNIPTDVLAGMIEPRTKSVPCKVSASIGCMVSHNEKLVECQNFRKSSQDVIEIQWTYSIINECSYPVRARRAMIMKCHKCPTLTSTNGPNSCKSDTNFFKEAKGEQDIDISGGGMFQLTEYDTVDLTDACDLSPIISSFSRFIAMRISADESVELTSSQVTAANSLGPVCRMTGAGPFPGSLSCETDQLWDDSLKETENGSL